jgi:hypothetical protein
MEFPSPQADDPDYKVCIEFNLIEPVALLMLIAQERLPFAEDILRPGSLQQLVDVKQISVAALPEKLRGEFIEFTSCIERRLEQGHVEPESTLADLLNKLRTVREDPASAKFGLLSEIYGGPVDLEKFFQEKNSQKDKPPQLLEEKFAEFLSPAFELDLQRIMVQNEIKKCLDLTIL